MVGINVPNLVSYSLQRLSLDSCSTIATNEYMDWLCMTRLQSHNIAITIFEWVACFAQSTFCWGVGILGQPKMIGFCWPLQDNLYTCCPTHRLYTSYASHVGAYQHSRLPCDHLEGKRRHLSKGKLTLLDVLAHISSE